MRTEGLTHWHLLYTEQRSENLQLKGLMVQEGEWLQAVTVGSFHFFNNLVFTVCMKVSSI